MEYLITMCFERNVCMLFIGVKKSCRKFNFLFENVKLPVRKFLIVLGCFKEYFTYLKGALTLICVFFFLIIVNNTYKYRPCATPSIVIFTVSEINNRFKTNFEIQILFTYQRWGRREEKMYIFRFEGWISCHIPRNSAESDLWWMS